MLRSRLISTVTTLLLALVLALSVTGTVAHAKRDHDEPPPGHAKREDDGHDKGRKEGHPHSERDEESDEQSGDDSDERDSDARDDSDEQEASPSPSSSPSPSDHPGRGRGREKSESSATLAVSSRVDSFLAQVGETVHYTVTVTNTGSDPVSSVQVVDSVPPEIALVRAAGATSAGAGQIVWDLAGLDPGEAADLTWTGVVRQAGDLAAVNSVVASAGEIAPASFENTLYLAAASAPDVTNPTGDVVRRKIVHYVRPAATAPTSESAQGSILPATGVDPSPWIVVGLTLFGLGAVFVASRSAAAARAGAAAIICFALIGTACVGGDEPRTDQETGTEARGDEDEDEGKDKDRVLGKRFGRDDVDEDAEDEGAEDESPDAGEDAAVAEEDEPGVAPPPAGPPQPAEPVRVVEVVTVQAEDLPIVDQGSRPGDNVVNYVWDDDAGAITQATSGRRFSADQPVELISSLGSGGGALMTEVSLTNLDRDNRLRVEGRFVLEITNGSTSTTLESEPVSVVLNPDGVISAEFQYRLPSGAYANSVSFRAE